MAHFAQLDENNVVINVIVVGNNDCLDANGKESEAVGIEFCKSLFGDDTRWAQTSYNGNFRKNYAGIGYTYDKNLDAFIPPKSFESWILMEETCQWSPPIPYPADGNRYVWDESIKNWVLTNLENTA